MCQAPMSFWRGCVPNIRGTHTDCSRLTCSESRDPRFENLSGKFSTDQFRKQYAFVYDEALPEEKRDLKSQMQVQCPFSVICTDKSGATSMCLPYTSASCMYWSQQDV